MAEWGGMRPILEIFQWMECPLGYTNIHHIFGGYEANPRNVTVDGVPFGIHKYTSDMVGPVSTPPEGVK